MWWLVSSRKGYGCTVQKQPKFEKVKLTEKILKLQLR